MSYMLDEIHQQPDVILNLVRKERAAIAELAREIIRREIQFVVMAARGTSDNAAVYGKYLLEINNGYLVALADPSVFTLYSARLRMDKALVIGISQSGQAADVTEYLEQSKRFGAMTVDITNDPGSTLAKVAHHTICCHAGEEKSVAATKTYTSTLAALYLLSAFLAEADSCVDELIKCTEAMRAAFEIEHYVADRAERYRYMRSGYVISRGLNYATAMETALKLAETSYCSMKAYSAADFLHGPIAAVHEAEPCFLIAPPGKAFLNVLDIAQRLRERNAETVVLSSEEEVLSLATTPFRLNVSVSEDLSPLVYIIPGQLLAYYLAVARGNDPDKPRGLTKITITR
ncbi:MAG: SIS domain-containing protein [Armatimonadetes bacterium]|nr:SIS domain-containing protein [Armatimonadota bacterium]